MPCSLTQVSPTTTTRRGFAPAPSLAGDFIVRFRLDKINRLVVPDGSQATSYTRHLSGHSFVVPIITIHASASKPVQCGNWLTTLTSDSQSLIHRINFETCGTATHWSGLFLLDPGTIQVRFEAIMVHFCSSFRRCRASVAARANHPASATQKSSSSKAIAFESGAKCPCQRNRVRSQAGFRSCPPRGRTRGGKPAMTSTVGRLFQLPFAPLKLRGRLAPAGKLA